MLNHHLLKTKFTHCQNLLVPVSATHSREDLEKMLAIIFCSYVQFPFRLGTGAHNDIIMLQAASSSAIADTVFRGLMARAIQAVLIIKRGRISK